MKSAYLLINIATIFFPVVLSFDKRVQFYKSWKFIWPGMAITGLIFLFWDILFTMKGVWSFNNNYITGINILHLPIEEVFFFLTVPFACIFIYACLNYYWKWTLPKNITKLISVALIMLSAVMIAVFYARIYTLVTFGLLLPLVVLATYKLKAQWLGRFYMAYIVSLLPFYIVNGILTSIPIVMYNNAENVGLRIGTIPFEDHFYSLALLIMNITFFEYFKSKTSLK